MLVGIGKSPETPESNQYLVSIKSSNVLFPNHSSESPAVRFCFQYVLKNSHSFPVWFSDNEGHSGIGIEVIL